MEGKSNNVIMIAILALLVVLIGAVVFFGVFVLPKMLSGDGEAKPTEKPSAGVSIHDTKEVQVDTITTNLARGEDGKSHIIKLTMALVIDNRNAKEGGKIVQLAIDKMDAVKDAIITVCGSLSFEDIDGNSTQGKEILKSELKRALNDRLETSLIYSINFTDCYANP